MTIKQLLQSKPIIRAMEAHSGLSAMIVENAQFENKTFDAIWLSSLTDSTVKGKPDIEFVDLTSRMVTVNDIFEVTNKPIIYDGDTGGLPSTFTFTVKRLERHGVSAVIIEDKTGAKRNSLLNPSNSLHVQDSIENVCEKIIAGKQAQKTEDFMIIARIESLITEAGMHDALVRAKAFTEAGADGIMIHSRKKDGVEILEFCKLYNEFENRKPLVAVPTNYPNLGEQAMQDAGINIIIYANQLLRASYTAMQRTANSILEHSGSAVADKEYISALNLISLIEGN